MWSTFGVSALTYPYLNHTLFDFEPGLQQIPPTPIQKPKPSSEDFSNPQIFSSPAPSENLSIGFFINLKRFFRDVNPNKKHTRVIIE